MEVMTLSDNILGKRMKWLRDREDFRQKRVADALGVSPYQLSRYESGISKPDPELIVKISDYYNVDTDFLLGKTESPQSNNTNDDKAFFMHKIANEFPDINLMFKDMESLTAEDMEEVYDYIKFKKSQKKEEN